MECPILVAYIQAKELEINELKRQNEELELLVAQLSAENDTLVDAIKVMKREKKRPPPIGFQLHSK